MLVTADSSPTQCEICDSAAYLCGVVDFHKSCLEEHGKHLNFLGIPVYYRKCEKCGFIFCDTFKNWIRDDFIRHIYNDDYAIVDPDYQSVRPESSALILNDFFHKSRRELRFIDYGGGNGLCARLLRDNGYAAETFDPFSEHNALPSEKADVVTAFEVVEHSNDQQNTLKEMCSFLKESGVILFSTLLQPADFNPFDGMTWWYIGPRNGHVSLHTPASLSLLFAAHGLTVTSLSPSLHLAYRKLPAFAAHLLQGTF